MDAREALLNEIQNEARQEVSLAAQSITRALARKYGDAVSAILFYGSCLRDQVDEGRVLDLYVVVDSYRKAGHSSLGAFFNHVLPPNVYYLEVTEGAQTFRAKYAVVSLGDFQGFVSARAFHPYFWARFCQPTAVPAVRDADTAAAVSAALATAVETMVGATRPLLSATAKGRDLWVRAFSETYRTELRAERGGRGEQLYGAFQDRYDRVAAALMADWSSAPSGYARNTARIDWFARRLVGKVLSVLRLAKAAFTFADGPDYILWKIEQHSGKRIETTAWQRRHPILSAPILLWKGLRAGAFR